MVKRQKIYGSIIACFLFFFVGHRLYFHRSLYWEQLCGHITYPFLKAQWWCAQAIAQRRQQHVCLDELQQQLAKTEADRLHLVAQLTQAQALLNQVEQTQELIEFKKRYEVPVVALTQVLMKHFSDQAHYFLLDAGWHKGIRRDMVAVYQNCLIGRVTEVYPHYCKLLLSTDRLCKIAAVCSQSKAEGIHEGVNELGRTALNFVTHLDYVVADDLICSSGQGLVFPKGFALGRIKDFKLDGLYYKISIEPLIDFAKINYCYIVAKGEL